MSNQAFAEQIHTAVETLQNGGIIAYPTEAVYGLGCMPQNTQAVEKLIQLKKRDQSKGLILIASKIEQFYSFIDEKHFNLHADIKAQWPGAITWVLPCKDNVSELLTGNRNTLAIRVSSHPVVKALCDKLNGCIVSTSANLSHHSPAINAQQVKKYFANHIDYIVDAPTGKQKSVTPIFDALSGKQLR